MARRATKPEEVISRQQADAAQHQRQQAAPSELWQALRQSAVNRQRLVMAVESAYTTRYCAHCGNDNTNANFAAHIMVTCPGCGRPYDQDINAAQNLLDRALQPSL